MAAEAVSDLRTASAADLLEQAAREGRIELSPLGWKLLEARRRVEQSGLPLLTDDEVLREVAERRGGIAE